MARHTLPAQARVTVSLTHRRTLGLALPRGNDSAQSKASDRRPRGPRRLADRESSTAIARIGTDTGTKASPRLLASIG